MTGSISALRYSAPWAILSAKTCSGAEDTIYMVGRSDDSRERKWQAKADVRVACP